MLVKLSLQFFILDEFVFRMLIGILLSFLVAKYLSFVLLNYFIHFKEDEMLFYNIGDIFHDGKFLNLITEIEILN